MKGRVVVSILLEDLSGHMLFDVELRLIDVLNPMMQDRGRKGKRERRLPLSVLTLGPTNPYDTLL